MNTYVEYFTVDYGEGYPQLVDKINEYAHNTNSEIVSISVLKDIRAVVLFKKNGGAE